MFKVLDLFSGIGGFSLALESIGYERGEQYFETIAFCEFDKHAQEILKLRWPGVPIIEDVREINEPIKTDIITAGFPCQPFSVAGARGGRGDDRYLWPELNRVISLIKPTWIILENVPGILSIEGGVVFGNLLSDLENSGYEFQTFRIGAVSVNAQHRRDRVWIICHAKHAGQPSTEIGNSTTQGNDGGKTGEIKASESQGPGEQRASVADTIKRGQSRQGMPLNPSNSTQNGEREAVKPFYGSERGIWSTQPRLGGEPNGISRWLDEQGLPKVSKGVLGRTQRLKQLGNSIVPQIVYEIGNAILEAEYGNP